MAMTVKLGLKTVWKLKQTIFSCFRKQTAFQNKILQSNPFNKILHFSISHVINPNERMSRTDLNPPLNLKQWSSSASKSFLSPFQHSLWLAWRMKLEAPWRDVNMQYDFKHPFSEESCNEMCFDNCFELGLQDVIEGLQMVGSDANQRGALHQQSCKQNPLKLLNLWSMGSFWEINFSSA